MRVCYLMDGYRMAAILGIVNMCRRMVVGLNIQKEVYD